MQKGIGSLGLLVFVAHAAACGAAKDDAGGTNSAAVSGLFGRVVDVTGAPVVGAELRFGAARGTTDGDGAFAFEAPAGSGTVTVAADGFVSGFEPVTVPEDVATALNVTLLAQVASGTLDAATGGTVTGPGGASLIAPPNAFVGPSGEVSGALTVYLTPLNPAIAAERAAAPGDFTASVDGQVKLLESFGMMDVTVMAGDDELNIAEGQRVQIRIPAPEGEAPSEIALWSLDESTGRWVPEGTATLNPDSGTYSAEIGHLSWWNADQVLETTCGRGCVVDSDGEPVAGARVTATGLDYAGASDATTGADGCFVVAVRKGSQLSVLATHTEGGGQVREVASGTADTDVPPSNPAVCTDWGTWTVEAGQVEFPDGAVVECEGFDFPLVACLPIASTLFECFDPAGACTYSASGGSIIEYANGARLEITSSMGGGAPGSVMAYFSSAGVACGTQTMAFDSADETGPIEATVTVSAPGGEAVFGYRMEDDSSDVTYRCEDGSTVVVTAAMQQQIDACFGGADSEECTFDGGGVPGSACQTDADCGTLTCCALPGVDSGICLQDDLCSFEDECGADADCAAGEACCEGASGTLQCLSADRCAVTECVDETDCGGSACCDGVCVASDTCDDGICADDSECPDGEVCCTGSGDPYCSAVDSCFSGADCVTDSDCGSDRGGALICCTDGGDTGTCEGADTCGSGDPCTADTDCQGSLVCCAIDGSTQICQAEADCGRFLPCTVDSDCGAAHICCERDGSSYCDLEATCALGAQCTADSDCGSSGALTCCDFGGSFSLCVEVENCP